MSTTEAESVGRALKGRRNGGQWFCNCPAHDDRTPSLSVATGRDRRLLVHCHAGCDPRNVFAELRQQGILDSCERRHRSRPIAAPKVDPAEEADQQRRVDRAVAIFHESGDIRGTLGERYLIEHRGITLSRDPEIDPCLFDRLRFHPACPFGRDRAPAVVAGVNGPSGCLRGVWRIKLDRFGRKVERLGLGDCRGGAVRLMPALDEDHLAVAEGIEDALAFWQLTRIATWAGCSTSGVSAMVLPDRFRRVTTVADADEPGRKAARALAGRLKAQGRAVRIIRPPAGCKDANEALNRGVAA